MSRSASALSRQSSSRASYNNFMDYVPEDIKEIDHKDVQRMWDGAAHNVLGRGSYGETRLVLLDDAIADEFSLKKPCLVVLKRFSTSAPKIQEEEVHKSIYRLLPAACRRYVCQPIPSDHNIITVQVALGPTRGRVRMKRKNGTFHDGTRYTTTLEKFVKMFHPFPEGANASERSKVYTDIMVRSDPHTHWIANPGRMRVVLNMAARALKCLHRIGILHHDVKPDNMIVAFTLDDVTHEMSNVRVALIDFGLARAMHDKHNLITNAYWNYYVVHPDPQVIKSIENGLSVKYWNRKHFAHSRMMDVHSRTRRSSNTLNAQYSRLDNQRSRFHEIRKKRRSRPPRADSVK